VIRLHLLGAARLESDRGPERHAVLSQPRRVALLAYLALPARQGPERRDTLLGVFWPESDTEHGRGALRNALHFLRKALGPEVIRSLGSEEVQLDLDRLWCDAVEFEQRCDAGDLSGALSLYGGDLLEGFFISGAPEFEHWLDGKRARLRQRAVAAARALAAEAETAGEPGVAAIRLRRLLELSPTDEAAARCLMRLLTAVGERGDALRVFIDLQARFEDELGLEPAEETRVLAEEIRASVQARGEVLLSPAESAPSGPTSEPVGSGPEPLLAAATEAESRRPIPLVPPPELPRAAKRRVLSHRRAVFVAAVAAAVVGLAAAPLLLFPGADEAPAVSADLVAVLPFQYRGAAEHSYLAEGLADLLAANLDGAGELRSVDPRALLAGLQSAEQPIEPVLARRKSADHGAGLYVLGSITEASGRLRITAALYGSGPRPSARSREVVVEGNAGDILLLVDQLTIGLLEGRGTTSLGRTALRSTHSIEALKAFLRGETALRSADVHGAIEHFRQATELDSTFALAHYRLSSAAYLRGLPGIPARSAAHALRYAPRLAREDSLLVAAWHHHVAGSVVEAHELYPKALWLRPGHVEANFQLGELLFHWGSALGIPASAAGEPFGRVLAAEPHNLDAALHLVRLAAREGRRGEVDSLLARMRQADPGGSWQVEIDALRAFLSADAAWQSRAIQVAGEQPPRDIATLESMAAFSYNLAAVERSARERLTLDRTAAEQARLKLLLVHLQLGGGRYREAERTLAAAVTLPRARSLEYRAMMATLPFRPPARDEVTEVRAEIAAHPDLPLHAEGGPISARGIEYPHLLWPGMFRPRRLYLLGALHARLGDIQAAAAVADSLAQEATAEPFADRYERLTRGRAAAQRGDAAAGLRALGSVQPPPLSTFESLVDYGRVYERWLRAELLQESGRFAEAVRWYATFPDPMGRDVAYLAPSHLRRAEIFDAGGEHEQAAFHYARFVELWADAEPELQPQVVRARQRLREIAR
jgi:DNA-binding SARP family transcriptional activator/TolB-like protein